MEPMKISFGFNKIPKKTTIISNNIKLEEKKVELIECLEGHSIKVKDAIEKIEQPLIIPLKDNQKNLLDRIRAAKKRDKQVDVKREETEDPRLDSELSVDELAARQLIKEAKDRLANGTSANNSKVSILPVSDDAPSLEGEKESTLEDYESVPVSDYGLALLRGMGWNDGMAIGKNASKSAAISVPELRPKGLGLGATKVVQSEMPTKKAMDKDGNELILKKGAFAKVIAGPQKGNYCEVQGFDEEAGRVIIKVYPKAEIVNINEVLLAPVTKEEFSRGSKVLNNAKYEEYKEISDKKLDNYRVKSEQSDSKQIKEESEHSHSNAEDESKSRRNDRHSRKTQKDDRYNSESPQSNYEKKIISKTSKYRERSRTPSKQREIRSFGRDPRKNKNKEVRESRSKSEDRNKSSSSKYKSTKGNSESSSASDTERYSKTDPKRSNEKDESSYRSRSKSKYTSKKDKVKHCSSDKEYYEKDKKSKKHTKSKNRDRSRSKSRDRQKRNKKHSSQRRDSSESDTDYKKDKRKKNKCKSRHRRNSSSSSEDRRYKSKK